jgi:ribonuclease HI
MREVTIVTDGSCIGNPGPGGWACILRCGNQEREVSGSNQDTTSNRMELMAAIEGLRALKTSCHVRLVSDSQYLYVLVPVMCWCPRRVRYRKPDLLSSNT